jgi:adenylosuccinate lyase
VHSQRVLLALTRKGLSREDSYALVQKHAMRTFSGEGALLDLLKQDKDVTRLLKPAELNELFDLGYHLKFVNHIFDRVFGPEPKTNKRVIATRRKNKR